MNSKNCAEGFCLFFLFVVVSTSQTKWPCVFYFENGRRFDLTLQNGNTSNSNQPYVMTTEQSSGHSQQPTTFSHSFYLCDSIKNPFSVPESDCTKEFTQICFQDYRSENSDEDVGDGPAAISLLSHGVRLATSGGNCQGSTIRSYIDALCPYNFGKKNNDYEVDLVIDYCVKSHYLTLYIDSACVGPLCCTYQDEEDSFNILSLCAENVCPSLTGFSLTHTSNLNGGDCSKCEPYLDDAKCCLYVDNQTRRNEKGTCELSGICPPKDGSQILVGEFPTTSIENCQVIQEFHASSSGKIDTASQPQDPTSPTSPTSPSPSSSSDDLSFLYFFLGLIVFFVIGMTLMVGFLYFKQKPSQDTRRQQEWEDGLLN